MRAELAQYPDAPRFRHSLGGDTVDCRCGRRCCGGRGLFAGAVARTRRSTARMVRTACIIAAGRRMTGRGASTMWPRRTLIAVTAMTGASQASSAAVRIGVDSRSCRSASQAQKAASANESAAAPNGVWVPSRRAMRPSARSVTSAAIGVAHPVVSAGRLARVRVMVLAMPMDRRCSSMPRCVAASAQLAVVHIGRFRWLRMAKARCSAVISARARGLRWACWIDRCVAWVRKRVQDGGRQRPCRRPSRSAFVAARLSCAAVTGLRRRVS